jgi:CheY-like chemotaxis protein
MQVIHRPSPRRLAASLKEGRPTRRLAGADRWSRARQGPGPRAVLIVEDDDFGRETLGQILEATGLRVRKASNGAEALELLGRDPRIGLIVLDLVMPRLNGWQFLHCKRQDARLRDIPVITLSAAARAPGRTMHGVVAHFEKPVAVDRLLAAIGEQLALQG